MKKKSFLVILVSFILSFQCYAQTEKGSWLIGGNINPFIFKGSQSNSLKSKFNLTSEIKLGVFIVNHFAVGLNLGEEFYKNKYSFYFYGDFEEKYFNLKLGPFLRFYPITKEKIGLFIEGGFNLGSSNFRSNKPEFLGFDKPIERFTNNKSSTYDLYVGPGISYFINPKIAFEFSASYIQMWAMTNLETRNAGGGLNAMIGINLFL